MSRLDTVRRGAICGLLTAGLVLLGGVRDEDPALAHAASDQVGMQLHRHLGQEPPRLEAARGADSARRSAPPLPRGARAVAPVEAVTVDSKRWAGAENAIYAADRHVVYIAYKRFFRDPYDPGGDVVEAQLCVAKSVDGGKTWSVTVVEKDAPELGDTQQQSVSIGGHQRGTVYVAYLVEGADARLKVARSTDAGGSWERDTIATGVGEYNAIKVIDAKTALVAANQGLPDALRLFETTDGGGQWDGSTIDSFGWYTGLDTAPSGRIWASYYHPGDTDLYVSSATSAGGPWSPSVLAGAPADGRYTGLGSSLAATAGGGVYVSYEDLGSGESLLWVSSSPDHGESWSSTLVDRGGWNTAIQALPNPALDTTDLFVAYWRPTTRGRVKVAHSADGGEQWSAVRVFEPRRTTFNLDLAVPDRKVQYVSYQAHHDAHEGDLLRVARLQRPGHSR